jgi:hypothetical protein
MPSEASIKQYESRIALLNKAGFTDFTEQADEVIKYLDAMATLSNRKLYTSAILYSYNGAPPPAVYKDYIAKQFAAQNVKDDEQKLSPKQDEKYLAWSELVDVQKKLADMEKNNKTDWREYLVVSLYTLIDPVRSDYGDMKVVRGQVGMGNQLVLGDARPYFLFREYKTAKIYGDVRIEIPNDLAEVIWQWFSYLNKEPEYLLDQEYSGKTLSNYIRRVFEKHTGKPVGINLIRHARITHELSTPKTILEKRNMARGMLHSTHRQERYYIANDTKTQRNDA